MKQWFNVSGRALVGQLFLDDVYVVAGLIDLTERLEVSEHRVLYVRIQHVFEKSREIFQRERVARYGKLELPVNIWNVRMVDIRITQICEYQQV